MADEIDLCQACQIARPEPMFTRGWYHATDTYTCADCGERYPGDPGSGYVNSINPVRYWRGTLPRSIGQEKK